MRKTVFKLKSNELLNLGNKVIITNAPNNLDTNFSAIINNMLPGVYHCYYEKIASNILGNLIISIQIVNENYIDDINTLKLEKILSNIESNSEHCGVFNYDYFTKRINYNDIYRRIKDLVYKTTVNLEYIDEVEYIQKELNFDTLDTAKEFYSTENYQQLEYVINKYRNSNHWCRYKIASNVVILNNKGVVTFSGNKPYDCYTAINSEGKVISIKLNLHIIDDEKSEDNMSCFNCEYQNIQETSHEWIECFCKKDGKKHDCYSGCDQHKEMEKKSND